jgi:hypothetical protein
MYTEFNWLTEAILAVNLFPSVQVQKAANPVRDSCSRTMARDGNGRPVAPESTDVIIAQVL